jgi:hypothetical protein
MTDKPRTRFQEDDPLLGPDDMASDANISTTTWSRTWRRDPRVVAELIHVSTRRIGMRRSAWRRILAEGVRK